MFDLALPATAIFDYPSVEALAGMLAPQVSDAAVAPPPPLQATGADAALADAAAAACSSDSDGDQGSYSDRTSDVDADEQEAARDTQHPMQAQALQPEGPGVPLRSRLSRPRSGSDHEQPNTRPRLAVGTINPHAPTLTRLGYFTVPSLRRLQRLSDAELRAVPRFVVGREGVGEVSFLYPGGLGWSGAHGSVVCVCGEGVGGG